MVGPMKRFRSNAATWIHISEELCLKLESRKSPEQCATKYYVIRLSYQTPYSCFIFVVFKTLRWKTIKRVNTTQRQSNKETGSRRTPVEYEDQLQKIRSIDDDLEPEVLRCPTSVQYKNSGRTEATPSPPVQPGSSLSSDSNSSFRSSPAPEDNQHQLDERSPSTFAIRRRKRAACSSNDAVLAFMKEKEVEKKLAMKIMKMETRVRQHFLSTPINKKRIPKNNQHIKNKCFCNFRGNTTKSFLLEFEKDIRL